MPRDESAAKPRPRSPNIDQLRQSGDLVDANEVSFGSLAGDHNIVFIEHLGQIYRLTATKAGKLVLTK